MDAREPGTESLTADISWLTVLQELPGLKRAAFPKPPAYLPKTAAPADRSWEGRDPTLILLFGTASRGHENSLKAEGFG